MKNKRNIILLAINLFVFIATTIITINGVFTGASEGQVGDSIKGLRYFNPFTIDSNVLLGLCSLILSIFLIKNLIKKEDKIPRWVLLLYYAGCVSTTLTNLTVIFFLTPTIGFSSGFSRALSLYLNDMFFFHVLHPILGVIVFIMVKSDKDYNLIDNLISIIPMIIYSIWYMINVLSGKWDDFYGFTFGGHYALTPIILVVMYSATFLIGFVLRKLNKKFLN